MNRVTPLGAGAVSVALLIAQACGDLRSLANTGLDYHETNHCLLVGKVGIAAEGYPHVRDSIVWKDRRNNLIREVDVSPFIDVIEGLTYVPGDDTFWLWGWEEGMLDMTQFLNVDGNGQWIRSVVAPPCLSQPGMIAYDEQRNGIWAKSNDATTAYLYDPDTWEELHSMDLGVGGEGIAVSPFDGTLYALRTCTLYQFSFEGDVLGSWPNPASGCETEDVVVDPSDRTVWIGADTFIHGGFDNGNRVWHVDPHHTYNKDVFFPNMCHWWLGSTEEPLFLAGDEIGIRDGEVGGVWLSPVIDFQGYCPEPAVLTNLAEWTATVRYRGGEEMPTSQRDDRFPLSYYDADQAGDGWGDSVPGDWQDSVPGNRYVQLEIVFARNEGGSETTHPVRMAIHYNDEDSPYEIEDFAVIPDME